MSISTHALDTSLGAPARGLPVQLWRESGDDLVTIGAAVTNADGRAPALIPDGTSLPAGTYRIRFDTDAYYSALGALCFYPDVVIRFVIRDPGAHHHVPLLLSPYGFSTYRGS